MNKENILSSLLSLGKNKDEIAASLFSRGIRGNRRNCSSPAAQAHDCVSSCPIAQFLASQFPSMKTEVIPYGTMLGGGLEIFIGRDRYWIHLEEGADIFRFILAFDRGEYPQLETP